MKLLIVSLVTAIRIPLALVSCWQMFQQNWTLAWLAFITGVATDVIDGRLARYWRVTTKGGEIADLASDVAMFWIYVPATCLYNHEVLWTLVMNAWIRGAVVLPLAIALACFVLPNPQLLIKGFRWWRNKGNFWFGVIPVGIVGCWLGWQVGWWALTLTIIYGVAAIIINRRKLMNFL